MASDGGGKGRAEGADYHSLLSLHHGLRLGRQLRGGAGLAKPTRADDPIAAAPTLDSWPELPDDQRALRESLIYLEPLQDALLLMYTTLFRHRPHLKGLFPGSIIAQRERLTRWFLRMIDGLDKPQELVVAIENLGRDHRKLGVLPQHYVAFAGSLTESLREAGGARWTEAYDQAWARLYWFTARIMIEAAREVTSDPPYYTAVVTEHRRPSPELAIIRVRTAEPYHYQAGQHATIEVPQLPHTWRCYSMADPPTDDGTLEFHVRAKGVGGVSDVLVKETVVGGKLRVGPARGDVRASSIDGPDLLLIAGGTGLAPIRSILGEVGRSTRPPRTALFFGARSRSELYDLDLLTEYAKRSPWLSLVLAVSGPASFPFESGDVPDVVLRYGPWNGYRAVVSGPRQMVSIMLELLPELGVPAEHILHDPE